MEVRYKIERDAIYLSYSDWLLLGQDKLPGLHLDKLHSVIEKVKASKKHRAELISWFYTMEGVHKQIYIRGSWCKW